MCIFYFFSVLVFIHVVNQVDSWEMTVTYNTTGRYGTSNVHCKSDVKLSKCNIYLYSQKSNTTFVRNFSLGQRPDQTNANSIPYMYKPKNSETDLESGWCGIKGESGYLQSMLLSCHLKAATGGWQSRTIAVNDDVKPPSAPETSVLVPGVNHTIPCPPVPVFRLCYLDLPQPGRSDGSRIESRWKPIRRSSDIQYSYIPSYDDANCSFTLINVTESDAGLYFCGYDSSVTPSIVIVPKMMTAAPELLRTSESRYESGDNITATCHVSNTIPVAQLTWYIGSKVIRNDSINDLDVFIWSWENQSITQHLSYTLVDEDNNKDLICQATQLGTVKKTTYAIKFTVCGRRNLPSSLVSRGQEAGVGEFPWHAGIFKDITTFPKPQCGGSLVKDDVIITAAHCFTTLDIQGHLPDIHLYKVVLGQHNLIYNKDDQDTQTFDLANVTVPEEYSGQHTNFIYDIAIVKLSKNATMTYAVQLICLDWENLFVREQLKEGNKGIVAGWGRTENYTQSEVLQWIELPWIKRSKCIRQIRVERLKFLTHDKFCAGYVNQGKSVCGGDSGGGLVFYNSTYNSYYLRGLVSTSIYTNITGACHSQFYTAFTSISAHLRFINDNVN